MNIRPFEIALIAGFVIAAVIGIIVLTSYKGADAVNDKIYGNSVVIWGTFDNEPFDQFLYNLSDVNKALKVVQYKKIDPRNFNATLLNAIADGNPPDIVVLPHELLVTYRSKLLPITYETFPERTFRDTYIDGADIFMRSDGIYGIPFAVDPLVMYWNKDIFSSSGLSQPPKTWESLLSQTLEAVVRSNDELEISQSAVALGEYSNVEHAKEILSMLLLQAGSTLVEEGKDGYAVTLDKSQSNSLPPGDAALNFYTQFVMPGKEYYSWNRSKQSDRKEFLGGTLALYFAPASERKNLERDNANLNFDTAPVPQGEGVTTARTYGDFFAFAIPRTSKNIQGAYGVATLLANAQNSQVLTDAYDFAPVQRSLYTGGSSDPHKDIAYKAALTAHGWLDPDPGETSMIFRKMIEDLTSGKVRLHDIIIDAVGELKALFR
jgi:ABC-type glycerol-3-phosphate transport system substrate-binding protein